MLIQLAGGNTSCKIGDQMWIKASGTLLVNALNQDIFVATNREKVLLEIAGQGDGSCRKALIDPECNLRPSIETTFHALLPRRFVFHFHSIHTICHTISVELTAALNQKLSELPWARVPYHHPGVPLTQAIREKLTDDVQIFVLENHGLIISGDELEEIENLLLEVERRLYLPREDYLRGVQNDETNTDGLEGWNCIEEFAGFARDPILRKRATAGSYYPDHVVFLGPALPCIKKNDKETYLKSKSPFPAVIVENMGVFCKKQDVAGKKNTHVFLQCLDNVLSRIPKNHQLKTIGPDAERALLNWDAEKYRRKLSKTSI